MANRCSPTDTMLLGSDLDFSEIESIPDVPVDKKKIQKPTTKIVFNNTIVPVPTRLADNVIVPDTGFKIPKSTKPEGKSDFTRNRDPRIRKNMDEQEPEKASVFSRLGRPAVSFSRYGTQNKPFEKKEYSYQKKTFKETSNQRSAENMVNTNKKYPQFGQNHLLGVNGAGPQICQIPQLSNLQFHQPHFTPVFSPIREHHPIAQIAPIYTQPVNNSQMNWNTNLTQKVMNNEFFYRDDESENDLVIDERYDSNVNSILGNASTDPIRKVTEWKKSSMIQESVKKEISHMDIKRHNIEFADTTYNTKRTGLELELINVLYRVPNSTPEIMKKIQKNIKKLTNLEDGQLYEGPEMSPLLNLWHEYKNPRSLYLPKSNHEEGRIQLTGSTFQYRKFKGYLMDQMNSDAIRKLVKEPVMAAMLYDVGYKTTQEDDGQRYLQHGTMEVWKNILKNRETQKPEEAGDLLHTFNEQTWNEEPLVINNLELRVECSRLMDMGMTTLGMDIKTMKADFPLHYELNMIICLQRIMSEWTNGQGSCVSIPVSSRVQIYQEERPFEIIVFEMDTKIENRFHTFPFPKPENIQITEDPDIRILLSAGYISNTGRLRKYKQKTGDVKIRHRLVKNSTNVAVRPGIRNRKTFQDVKNQAIMGTSTDIEITIEELETKYITQPMCACDIEHDIPVLQTQVCYPVNFYEFKKDPVNGMVHDETPWVNSNKVAREGVNPAMNTYCIKNKKLLAPSEPGAVVATIPHVKRALFCGTTDTEFRDGILRDHTTGDMIKTIEKEINQASDRLSNRAIIGAQMEDTLKTAFNSVPSYVANNPIIPPTMFSTFTKFYNTGDTTETCEVKDMEHLFRTIHTDLKKMKEICCPWCLNSMNSTTFKIHYLQDHRDTVMLINTADVIQSNQRALISLIMFFIGALEKDIELSNNNVIQQLKDIITKLQCEIEIIKDTPTLPDIKNELAAEKNKYAEIEKKLETKEKLLEVSKNYVRNRDKIHKQELDRLKQEIKKLKTMNETKDTNTQELEKKLKSETMRNKMLTEKIFTLEMSYGKLQSEQNTKLEAMMLNNEMLSGKINTLEMESEKLKEEIDEQEKEINTLEMESEKLKEEINEQEKEINTLDVEIDELKLELDTQEEIFIEMDNKLDNMGMMNNTLQDDNETVNATILHQNIVCDGWKRSINEMKQEIKNRDESLLLMEEICEEEKDKNEKLVKKKDYQINSLKRKLESKKNQLQTKNRFIYGHVRLGLEKYKDPTRGIPSVPHCEAFQLTESASTQTESINIPKEQSNIEFSVSNVGHFQDLLNSFKVIPETDSD